MPTAATGVDWLWEGNGYDGLPTLPEELDIIIWRPRQRNQC